MGGGGAFRKEPERDHAPYRTAAGKNWFACVSRSVKRLGAFDRTTTPPMAQIGIRFKAPRRIQAPYGTAAGANLHGGVSRGVWCLPRALRDR